MQEGIELFKVKEKNISRKIKLGLMCDTVVNPVCTGRWAVQT